MEGRVFQVLGRAVGRVDLEPPGQVRRPAEELLIGVVAEAPDRLGERRPGRRAVQDHEQRDAVAARTDGGADGAAENRAVDAEAALLDPRDVAQVPRERRPVGDDVVEARSHDAERHRPDRDLAGQRRIAPAQRQLLPRDEDGDDDADRQQDAVPAGCQRAQMEDERVGRARDRGQQHASKIPSSPEPGGPGAPMTQVAPAVCGNRIQRLWANHRRIVRTLGTVA